jgi:hypothetical protein
MTWFRDLDGDLVNAGPDARVLREHLNNGDHRLTLYLAAENSRSDGYPLAEGSAEEIDAVLDRIGDAVDAVAGGA